MAGRRGGTDGPGAGFEVSEREALYAAILAEPANDLPRLVFADYLDERGESDRAEFIRAQIRIANEPEYETFHVYCKIQKPEWFTGQPWFDDFFQSTWREFATSSYPAFELQRGFPSSVGVHSPQYLNILEPVLFHFPIRSLSIGTGNVDQWKMLAQQPWLAKIEEITFTGLNTPIEPLRYLSKSEFTTGLRGLHFDRANSPAMSELLAGLFETELGDRLQSLSLRFGYGSADDTIEAISQNPNSQLREYYFLSIAFGPSSIRAFVQSGLAAKCEVLRVPGNPVMQSGLEILATAAEKLRILDLGENSIMGESAAPLIGSGRFPQLRKLNLAGNRLGAETVRDLARAENLKGLRSLGLSQTSTDNRGVRYLTRGKVWPNLVEVDLTGNPISDDGAKHLLSAVEPPELMHLKLTSRHLTEEMQSKLTERFGAAVQFEL